MKNLDRIKSLVDQLLETAEIQDQEHKKQAIANHQGQKAQGNSFMVFHLKQLKQALEEEDQV